MKKTLILTFCVAVLGSPQVSAKDHAILVSGGGAPESNHYSQYLQSKTLLGFLKSKFTPSLVTVFFGAGNLILPPHQI